MKSSPYDTARECLQKPGRFNDAHNRLTNILNTAGASVVGIGYDPQGNLANKNGQAYDFDYGNRLRNVPGKEWYRYDGLGRRVQTTKSDDSQTTLWQYGQAGQMLFSTDWEGSKYLNQKTHESIYLAGSLIATIDHAWPSNAVIATKYQHTDALGSPVAVTNETGAVIERNDYEPWGAIIGNPTRSGIGYTGHVMDGVTGLTYMQQRYYDQSIGRFLSGDPVLADANSGAMFNRYSYAYNSPYKFNDPDGEKGKIGWAAELGVGTIRLGARVTMEQAVKLRRAGKNFFGDSHRISRRVETTAHGRHASYRDVAHELKDEAGNKIGKKGFPNYQTEGVSGHSFYGKASTLAATALGLYSISLTQQADAAEKAAEVIDLFDPTTIGDAGVENECANSCGVSDAQLRRFRDEKRIGPKRPIEEKPKKNGAR